MQVYLIYILLVILLIGILVWYINNKKHNKKQNPKNIQKSNVRIMDKNPLDNATYIECHDVQEANRENMLDEILHQWKITNFWLGCIGIVFLFIMLGIIISIIFSIQVGREVNDIFRTLQY